MKSLFWFVLSALLLQASLLGEVVKSSFEANPQPNAHRWTATFEMANGQALSGATAATSDGVTLPTVYRPFGQNGETVAIAFLVDQGGNWRGPTVEIFGKYIAGILESAESRHQVGLYTFQEGLRELNPIGSPVLSTARKALGLSDTSGASMLFQSSIEAVKALAKVDADRRVLVVLGSGKADDVAFGLENLVAAAVEQRVAIHTIGYAERKKDRAYLQNLEQMAIRTGGRYAEATGEERALTRAFINSFFLFVENGGQVEVTFGDSLYGELAFKVELDHVDGGKTALNGKIDIPLPVAIVKQPEAVDVDYGGTAVFSIETSGEGVVYQWFDANTGELLNSAEKPAFKLEDVKQKRTVYAIASNSAWKVKSEEATVFVKPVIAKQPSAIEVYPGDSGTLALETQGDGLKVQWYDSDTGAEVSGANAFSFTTPPADETKRYHAVVSNADRSVSSSTVEVKVVSLFSAQPESQAVPYGSPTTLTVETKEAVESYQWYDAETKEAIVGAVDKTLETEALEVGRSYYVEVAIGDRKWTSEVATVSLSPRIVEVTPSMKVTADEDVSLSVTAEGPELTYQWYTSRAGADEAIEGEVNPQLFLKSVSEPQGYRVKVSNPAGEVISEVIEITIAAAVAPSVAEVAEDEKAEDSSMGQRLVLYAIGLGAVVLVSWIVFAMRTKKRPAPPPEPMPEDGSRFENIAKPIPVAKAPSRVYGSLKVVGSGGAVHEISTPAYRIGWGESNDLRLMDDTVSGSHAEIVSKSDGSMIIADLDSANGVYVNHKKVKTHTLADGDVIKLGEVKLKFSLGKGAR